jgi:DNA replication and repair protein RecF
MRIASLHLQHFRNFDDLRISFEGSTIGFLGENAQGKTNLLESIYILSTGGSWRASEDSELVQIGEHFARVDGSVFEEREQSLLGLVLQKEEGHAGVKKSYLVNEIKRKKETFLRVFPAVLFSPEDISLVIGSPSLRRKVLDVAIIEAFPHYSHILSQYGKVLTSRNRILDQIRERVARVDQLDYWTDAMVTLGSEIYAHRYAFFAFCHMRKTNYSVEYRPHILCDVPRDSDSFLAEVTHAYRKRLSGNLDKEILSATSQYGPHKDDYVFYLDSRDVASFGSRGEQRGAVLYFKKMQLLFVHEARKTPPILLLDDIFSEFDRAHRYEIGAIINGYQTFITGTEEQFFRDENFGFDMIFRVENGKISL